MITITEKVTTTVEKKLFVPENFMKAITLDCEDMNCMGLSCANCLLGGRKRENLKAVIESLNK
jgi:hypothetical protein